MDVQLRQTMLLGNLHFSDTDEGEFETKWKTVDIADGYNVPPLSIMFKSKHMESWTVNSIIVERGDNSIKIQVG